MLKSCLRSGDMVLLRRESGSLSSTRSRWCSLELLVDRGKVSDPTAGLTSTALMLLLHRSSAGRVGWEREKQLASHSGCHGNGLLF